MEVDPTTFSKRDSITIHHPNCSHIQECLHSYLKFKKKNFNFECLEEVPPKDKLMSKSEIKEQARE